MHAGGHRFDSDILHWAEALRKCLVDIFGAGARWRLGVIEKFIDILGRSMFFFMERCVKSREETCSKIEYIIFKNYLRITRGTFYRVPTSKRGRMGNA